MIFELTVSAENVRCRIASSDSVGPSCISSHRLNILCLAFLAFFPLISFLEGPLWRLVAEVGSALLQLLSFTWYRYYHRLQLILLVFPLIVVLGTFIPSGAGLCKCGTHWIISPGTLLGFIVF